MAFKMDNTKKIKLLRWLIKEGKTGRELTGSFVSLGKLELFVKRRNYKEFKNCHEHIEELLKKGESVPAIVLSKWISLIWSQEEMVEELDKKEIELTKKQREKQVAQLSEKAYQYFTKKKLANQYDFSGQLFLEIPDNGKIPIEYSFKELLKTCIEAYLIQPFRIRESHNKDSAIHFFYNEIVEHSLFFRGIVGNKLTDSKKRTISAYLMIEVANKHMIYEHLEMENQKLNDLANGTFKKLKNNKK